jgi:large subunit ribosomal protein L9
MARAAIAAEGIEIDKRRIDLAKPIKVVGEYPVNVALYRDIKATVNVAVIDQKTVEEAPAAEAEAEEAQVEAMVEEAVAEVEAAVEEIVAEVQAETAE